MALFSLYPILRKLAIAFDILRYAHLKPTLVFFTIDILSSVCLEHKPVLVKLYCGVFHLSSFILKSQS